MTGIFIFLSVILLCYILIEITEVIMANVQELRDSLTAIAEGVNGLENAIVALKEQLAQGQVVTQEDLDQLAAAAQAIVEDLADTTDQG